MAHRTTRFVRPRPATKMWIGVGVGTTTIVSGTIQVISTLSAGALLLRPFTVLRTRLEVLIGSDQAGATEQPVVALGRIVVTEKAAGLGPTAVPDPDPIGGQPEADWFVHQFMSYRVIFSSAAAINMPVMRRYTIDSKAMRKVGPDDDIAMVTSEIGAKGALLTTGGRQLIQLH